VDFKDFSIISIYIHSGSAKQQSQDLKMEFLTQRFSDYTPLIMEYQL